MRNSPSLSRLFPLLLVLVATALLVGGCGGIKITVGPDSKEPLKEFTIEGRERGKVLVIPVRGFISDAPRKGILGDHASMVQEVVSQLRKAEKEADVRAVVFEINSAGGSTTASDILYHEIAQFKARTGATIVAALMDVAASGGYYIALPADRIVAHPTTITGSVGVIFIKPKITGLMDKLGLAVEVNKSGKEKDIGSPFRATTPEEEKIFQDLTDTMGGRFLGLVEKHRGVTREAMSDIATARIYLADDALRLKLVDRIGYLPDAVSDAKELAGLSKDAKVVVYRRSKYANDTLYNTSASQYTGNTLPLVDLPLLDILSTFNPGLYYLWTPGNMHN